MRTLSQHDGQSGQLTADIEARIRLLFARYPTLCGFAVQSRGQLPEHSDPYPIPEADLCLTDVGVLNSSRFASLHPGYFVVFTGVFDAQPEATSALPRARAAFPLAYAREIVP